MTKTTNLNHFLGGAGWLGAGFGGWLGVKLFSGVWCVPCISPMDCSFDPIIGCVAGTNGCVGTCCVSVISLAGAVLGAAFVAGIKAVSEYALFASCARLVLHLALILAYFLEDSYD